jgi:hypothetical protein
MERSFTDIIRGGLWNGDSFEVINKNLKEAGATFSLVEDKMKDGWTKEEMVNGFVQEPVTEDVKTLADLMERNMEYAGYTKRLSCKDGTFDVTYESNGYAVKAVRV